MGDGGIASSPTDEPPLSFSEFADEMCAYYMAIGVPYKEYWYGDPAQLRYYVRAHELKNEQKNEEIWLQGLYVFKAFDSIISTFSWQLGGRKGKRPEGYIDKPIRLTEKTEEEKRRDEINQAKKIINDFDAWSSRLNAHKR